MRRTGMTTTSRATAIGLLAATLVLPAARTGDAQTPPPAQTPPAQPPAAAPAQPPAPVSSFSGDAGMMNYYVKPDKTADFEAIMNKYKEALSKTENADLKKAAAGMRLYKSLVAAQGNTVYIMVVDPAVQGVDYSANGIIKALAAAFPSEGTQLYQQLKDAFVGNQPLNITPVLDFGK